MIEKNVAIGVLARNCEKNLPENIGRLEELRNSFSSSSVFIYENNSTDGTKAILKKWQEKGKNVFLQSEDIDESVYQTKGKVGRLYCGTGVGRIRKMCDCRNKLLALIRSNGCFDYVIFVDIDVEWFSVEGIVKSIENAPEGWGGLFSNSFVTFKCGEQTYDNPLHYDTFAFLKKGKSIEQIKQCDLNIFFQFFCAKKIFVEINNNNYLECESAFGGVGIYKGDKIKELRYEIYTTGSWGHSDSALCEHILFNSRVPGNKYISKELKVCYHVFPISEVKMHMLKYAPFFLNLLGKIRSLV